MTIVNILVFALILIVLIVVHEAGHMVAARRCGMRVERFSVFMGRPIWSFRRGETEYALGWLPIGGYVKISGMTVGEEIPPGDDERSYIAAKPWKKIVTIAAGPAVNIALAFLLFCVVFWIGPTLYAPTTAVAAVTPGSPAAAIGLRPGDVLLSVNRVKGSGDFYAVQKELQANPGKFVTVRYSRGEGVRTVRVKLARRGGVGILGFNPRLAEEGHVGSGFLGGIEDAGRFTWFVVKENGKVIGSLATSEKARENLSGPVGTAAIYNQVAEAGFVTVLRFIALISLALGLFNLLPLLPLDGGHILFAIIEKLKGSPVRPEIYMRAQLAGFALVLIAGIFILQQDIGRITTGDGFRIR